MNRKRSIISLQFDKYKCVTGIVLAALALMISISQQAPIIGFIFVPVFLVVGAFKIKTKNIFWQYAFFFIWMAAATFMVISSPTYTVGALHWMTVTPDIVFLNYLCVLMVFMFFMFLTARPRLSVILGSLFLLLLVTLNGFVFQFRGRELGFSDIFSLQTAINVAGQYHPRFTPEITRVWLWFLSLLFAMTSCPKPRKIPARFLRIFALLATFFLWLPLNPSTVDVPIKTWESEGTRLNGFYINMYMSIRDSAMKKPKDYNPDTIRQLSLEYPLTELPTDVKKPNILVIMDESFADFRIFGDPGTTQTITPFLNNLTENTVRGYALASVYGGNTANTEFEFLTGHSMAFFPDFSVPYQQYLHGETHTLATLMKDYGYKTIATHPYHANGWSRDKIYPFFGFEESSFLEAYETNYPVRKYTSDRDMFDYALTQLENKNDERPLFLFGITMQNHGGYDYEGEYYHEALQLTGFQGDYPLAQQYLNLLHETDMAVEYLLSVLKDFPEETIVLFFGDHLPKLETKFYEEIYGSNFKTLPEQELHYAVPFYIWANYDIPESTVPCTSINYLATHLLKTAGLPLSPYLSYLENMETKIPAINTLGYYSISKNTFLPLEDAPKSEEATLSEYAALTYNQLFDKKNKNSLFFP